MGKSIEFLAVLLLLFAFTACKEENVQPSEMKANIGEPFTVSAPATVVFEEAGFRLRIEHFTKYPVGSIVSPHTTVRAVFEQQEGERTFELFHYQSDEGIYKFEPEDVQESPEQVYREVAYLNDDYVLVFEKVNWKDERAPVLEVETGQFVIKRKE